MNSWYFICADRVHGPVTTEALTEHAAEGRVEPDTLVWSACDETPRPVALIPEVRFFFSHTALRESHVAAEVDTMPLGAWLSAWSTIVAAALSATALVVWSALWVGGEDLGSAPVGRGALIFLALACAGFWIYAAAALLRGLADAMRWLWWSQIPAGLAGLTIALLVPDARALAFVCGAAALGLGLMAFCFEARTLRWVQTSRMLPRRP